MHTSSLLGLMLLYFLLSLEHDGGQASSCHLPFCRFVSFPWIIGNLPCGPRNQNSQPDPSLSGKLAQSLGGTWPGPLTYHLSIQGIFYSIQGIFYSIALPAGVPESWKCLQQRADCLRSVLCASRDSAQLRSKAVYSFISLFLFIWLCWVLVVVHRLQRVWTV